MGRASLPGDLKARVLSATRQEPSPTRRAAGAADAIVLAATAAAVLNLFLGLGGLLPGQPIEHVYVVTSWTAIGSAATWAAFGRGKSMLGRQRSLLVTISASTVVACVGVVAMAPSSNGVSGSLGRALLTGTLTSTIILAGFTYVRRGSELRHPRAAGAALGAASATWAGLVVELNQPQHGFVAGLLVHLLPMLAAIAVGYEVAGRMIVGRSSSSTR